MNGEAEVTTEMSWIYSLSLNGCLFIMYQMIQERTEFLALRDVDNFHF